MEKNKIGKAAKAAIPDNIVELDNGQKLNTSILLRRYWMQGAEWVLSQLSPHLEVKKIGDGRIVYNSETYVNEKSGRVLSVEEFRKKTELPSPHLEAGIEDFDRWINENKLRYNGICWYRVCREDQPETDPLNTTMECETTKELYVIYANSLQAQQPKASLEEKADEVYSLHSSLTEIEDVVINFKRGHVDLEDVMKKVKLYLKKQPKAESKAEGIRWVKASDRLPELHKRVFVKMEGWKKIGAFTDEETLYLLNEQKKVYRGKFNTIEWLEETQPTPIPATQ